MAAGSLRCPARLLTHAALLLLGLHAATACEEGKVVVWRKVGDTVEFSPCVSGEIDTARWSYKGQSLYRQNRGVTETGSFKSRLQVKPGNFSLTVKHLTTEDSGDFVFSSALNGRQIPSTTFTLNVREPLTQEPELSNKTTWHPENQSCSVSLACRAAEGVNVSFRLTVGEESLNTSTLTFLLKPSDGSTHISCTISNSVSQKMTAAAVTCTNQTLATARPTQGPDNFITILSVSIAGGLLLVVLVVVAVIICHCKNKQTAASKDTDDLTVYADITENMAGRPGRSSMKPCSLYDTIENSNRPEAQTVYDKIQLGRIRKTSVSPYQEVS